MPILDSETGAMGVFIPSCIENNGILLARGPGYVTRLKSVGSLLHNVSDGNYYATRKATPMELGAGHLDGALHYGGAASAALVSHEVAKGANDAYRSQKVAETNGHLGNAG